MFKLLEVVYSQMLEEYFMKIRTFKHLSALLITASLFIFTSKDSN